MSYVGQDGLLRFARFNGATLSIVVIGAAESVFSALEFYVRTDGGAWIPWLSNTTATSALWTGAFGHSYEFVSIARDGGGNVEGIVTAATPPDAQTSVPGTPGACSTCRRARCVAPGRTSRSRRKAPNQWQDIVPAKNSSSVPDRKLLLDVP